MLTIEETETLVTKPMLTEAIEAGGGFASLPAPEKKA